MKSRRVMIIEDNPINMKLAHDGLELHEFELCCATNAKEALAKIDVFQPSVILMDIQLPDVDGLALTRQIKANPKLSATVIIAITAYAMKSDQEKALAAGCDEYVTKPADILEVIKLIEKRIGNMLA